MPETSERTAALATLTAQSAKASDVARQLAFAGLAVVWAFRRSEFYDGQRSFIPGDLLLPATAFAAGLFFDLMQYSFGALRSLAVVLRRSSKLMIRPMHFLHGASFIAKVLLIALGYAGLVNTLFRHWLR